ncbi:MAG: laminin B domain-containing protein [Phycisphaerales bacterium]
MLNRAAAVLLFSTIALGARADVTSRFDSGSDGWNYANCGFSGSPCANSRDAAAPWEAATQSIRIIDLEGETCIDAPAQYLGDKSASYGKFLRFDTLYRTRDETDYSIVVLCSGELTLYRPWPRPTLNVWIHNDVLLTEAGWHVGGDTGPAATAAQMHSVLSNLGRLFIRTEWTTGPDDTNVDNVLLEGAGTTCVGDLNSDGFVDDTDFVLFLSAYNILDCADPGMAPACPADFNHDQVVDDSDFVLFVGAYNELICP